MATGKRISQDQIQFVVDVKAEKVQQEVHKLQVSTDNLQKTNKKYLESLIKLEAAGKKGSEEWKNLNKEYKSNNKIIRENKKAIAELTSQLKTSDLTMNQLKKQARDLRRQLDNTSKSLNPEAYRELEGRLRSVTERMNELKESAKSIKNSLLEEGTMSFIKGTIFVKLAEYAGGALQNIKELASAGIELAESADGVVHAFENIDNHSAILKSLRQATKGTVNDFELMKAAVQAKDFRIPLEELGKYLQFAQLKAQQTGQSVEYMTNSIVTGLGRKSKMILDNLGISASEIDEKVAETGDFMKAVASIIENQLAQAGETYISAADRAAKKTVDLENAQLAMGRALLPWNEAYESAFGGFQISIMKAVTWLLTHKNATAALTVATIAFSVAIVRLNTSVKAYVASTKLAKAATVAWQTAVTTFRGVMLLTIAAVNTFTGNTTRATAAMKLFNTTCKANVYMAVATAIIAAGVALYGWITKNKQAKAATQDFLAFHKKMAEDIAQQEKDMAKAASSSIAERIAKLKSLRNTINDANESQAKRKSAIQDLQKLVPGYHASIEGEGRLFAQNTQIIDQYINKLKQAALAEAAYERIKENEKKILEAQLNIEQQQQNIRNIKGNAKNKTGVDLDEMNIGPDGRVRFNDVHDSGGHIDKVKLNYEWDPGDKKDYLKVQQDGIQERTQLISKEQSVVDAYSKQNDRLWQIVKENGGTGQSVLNPVFLNHDKNSGSHTDKIGKEQEDVFANERKEQLDQQEKLYQQMLENLKQSLIQRKITQEQFNAQELSLSMGHAAKVYSIEQEFSAKAQDLEIKDANEKQRIILNQQSNEEKARRDFQQKSLAAMKQYYDNQKKLEEASLTSEQKQERDYKLQLAALKAYYDAAIEYAKAHGESDVALTEAYEKAKLAIIEAYAKKQEEARRQAREQAGLTADEEQLAADLQKLKADYDKGLLSKEEYEKAVAQKEAEYARKKKDIRIQLGIDQQKDYDRQLEQLKEALEKGYITQEEYEKRVQQLKRQSFMKQFNDYRELFSGAVTALQDAELANVDAKYDAEIEAARQAGEDTTELENKKANEKLKIQKKYADVNFAISASQIITQTAEAIMKALAELGPIAGPVSAALMGVTGAAQLAVANAERQKVKKMTLNGSSGSSSATGARVATGFEDGGLIDVDRLQDGKRFRAKYDPRRRGYVDGPTVIVGEGPAGKSREWVASNAALRNPTVAPLIDIIDRAQRLGNISSLDMRKYLLAQQVQGLASGGSVSTTHHPTPTTQHPTPDTTAINRLTDVLDRMERNGIPSIVALTDLDAQQKLRDRARHIGSK